MAMRIGRAGIGLYVFGQVIPCGDGYALTRLLWCAQELVGIGVRPAVFSGSERMILMNEIATDMHVAAVVQIEAAIKIDALLKAVSITGNARVGAHAQSVVLLFGDDVDHTCDGI